MIEQMPGGGTMITGEHINLYYMLGQRGLLKLEIKGIRMGRRSAYAFIKKTYGLKGNKEKVLLQFEEVIRNKFPGSLQNGE